MIKIEKLAQDSQVIKLIKQRDMVFPLEIINRVFRDDYALAVPKPRFFTVWDDVRSELNLIHGADRFSLSFDEQIIAWTSRHPETAAWFTQIDHPDLGRSIEITPAARSVHDILIMSDTQEKALSGQAIEGILSNIMEASARLRGDNASLIRKAEREIEERQLMIDRLRTLGETEVSEQDKQMFASNLARLMIDLNQTITIVPERLKIANRTAREVFHHSKEAQGEVMKEMINIIMTEVESPGYAVLETVAELASHDERREEIDEAIRTITDACGDMMTQEMREQSHDFLGSIARISRQVISQHRTVSDTLVSFVKSRSFQSRNAEMRALSNLTDVMKKFAEQARLGKRSLAGFGLKIRPERAARSRLFDLRLASHIPNKAQQEMVIIADDAPPSPEVLARAKLAAQKAYLLETDRMKSVVERLVLEHGPIPLSWILKKKPPQYGSEEIAKYIQIALERMPSVFPKGWKIQLSTVAEGGVNREYYFSDPVFMTSRFEPQDAIMEAELVRPRGQLILHDGSAMKTMTDKDDVI